MARAVGIAVAFAVTFLLRFTTAGFGNDHFTHLSRARQILLGDWPIRDFFDPGQFLHYYLSAAAQVVFGYNLFGEALLTIGFIALAAALTFDLSLRLARSLPIAAAATTISVIAFPRLYNYPKVFLYVAAIWLFWWYAHHPARWRIGVLAAFSMLAFLFRFDHGVYIGAGTVLLLTLVHWSEAVEWWKPAATFAVTFIVLLLPFAVYVQWAAGIPEYIVASAEPARFVTQSVRRLPSVLTRENALVWFTTFTMAVPVLALALGAWTWAKRTVSRSEAATVVASACLCLVITRALVGNDPDTRLADVISPTIVLAAWLAGRWLSLSGTHAGVAARTLRQVALVVVFSVTFWSVATQARLTGRLDDADLRVDPLAAWAHLGSTYRRLHLRPIDDWARPGADSGIQGLARYVLRCTSPDDRLLVAGAFAPEVFFYAERGFAGGQVHFLPNWHRSPADQRLTIERLRSQSVPVVLVGDQESLFEETYPDVAGYIRTRYVEVPHTQHDGPTWRVLVHRGRTFTSTDALTGLPCTPGLKTRPTY